MSEEEIGQIRVFLADKVVEGVFILHHRVETLIAPVTPDSADHRSLSVTDMIVGRYDVACVEKGRDHMNVSSRMFSESVDQLNNSLRLGCGNVDPALHIVTLIVRKKTHFM